MQDKTKVFMCRMGILAALLGCGYVTASVIKGKPLGNFNADKITNIFVMDDKQPQDKATLERLAEEARAKAVHAALLKQEYKKFAKVYSPEVAKQKAERLVQRIMDARQKEREAFNQKADMIAAADDDVIAPMAQGILPVATTASPFMPSAENLAMQNDMVEKFKQSASTAYKKVKRSIIKQPVSNFAKGDADRKAILNHELQVKQTELQGALSTGNDAAIRRIQNDIANIRKELKI